MSKFTDPLDLRPIPEPPRKRKTADQIAATGRAFPDGMHTLTESQQRAWFNAVPFTAPVEWRDEAFYSDGNRITPHMIEQMQEGSL